MTMFNYKIDLTIYIITNVKWIILLSFMCRQVTCQDCKPVFYIQTKQNYEYQPNNIFCDLSENMDCHDIIKHVMFAKQIGPELEDIFRIEPGGDNLYYNMSDGYTLFNRSVGFEFYHDYRLNINTTILEDTGDWLCYAQLASQETPQFSETDSVLISTRLIANDITVEIPGYVLLGTETTYTCSSTRVHPRPRVEWEIAGQSINGSVQDTSNGIAWDIKNVIQYTFTRRDQIDVTCVFHRHELNVSIPEDADKVQLVYAPATVENSTQSHTTPKLTDDLILKCKASGSDVKIEWFHNEALLAPGLYDNTYMNVSGDFNYGETTAIMSTLEWKLPDIFTCDNVDQHDGEYNCKAQGFKGDPDVSKQKLSVDVQYTPILTSPQHKNHTVTVGDPVTLECTSCSNPFSSIQWISVNGHHDLSNKTTDKITFDVKDKDTVICNVSNTIGSVHAFHDILAKEPPTEEPTSEPPVIDTTEPDTEEPPTTKDPLRDTLVIANAVIWSLCGVVAVVLVCLAVYHYKQIQRGKKNMEYSDEAPIIDDDEAKPSTSRVYDDINIPVAGSVVGEVVDGVPEGLYDEVQRHAHAPVAPKRTSKEKTKQHEACSPKPKIIQDPSVPNPPLNGRREERGANASDGRSELAADYSPDFAKKEMPSKTVHKDPVSKVKTPQGHHESPNKTVGRKQNHNVTKPSVPTKPNIQSIRLSSSSDIASPDKNPAGHNYYNAEATLYANCDQSTVQKNADGTITYADLQLQHEDPYNEGAPPIPLKNMGSPEPVQYASIKHNK